MANPPFAKACQLLSTVRMLAALLSFCTSASFYTAFVMVALWLWKELTMGIYRGKERLDGKLVVITGANCGIGLEVRKADHNGLGQEILELCLKIYICRSICTCRKCHNCKR